MRYSGAVGDKYQNAAAAGHADIQAYSAGFRVVGSTETVDARDNTGTTGTGVAIYWLGGNKIADDYADFYDGTWANTASPNPTDESGNAGAITNISTGSNDNGTKDAQSPLGGGALGLTTVGDVESITGNPIDGGAFRSSSRQGRFYALSQVFQVATPSTDATLSGLTLSHGTLDPVFDSDTTSYEALVANGVAQVTLTETTNDAGFSVFLLSAERPDGAVKDVDFSSLAETVRFNAADFSPNTDATAYVLKKEVTVTLHEDTVVEGDDAFEINGGAAYGRRSDLGAAHDDLPGDGGLVFEEGPVRGDGTAAEYSYQLRFSMPLGARPPRAAAPARMEPEGLDERERDED